MRSKFRGIALLLVITSLFVTILACRLGNSLDSITGNDSNKTLDQTELLPTARNTDFQSITIQLTESQVNALVSQTLQDNPDQQIQSASVQFVPGKMIVDSQIVQDSVTLPLRLELTAAPDGQGSVAYQIVSANVGPFPLPQSTRDQITTQLSQFLNPAVAELTGDIFIDEIVIGQGIVTITGHPR